MKVKPGLCCRITFVRVNRAMGYQLANPAATCERKMSEVFPRPKKPQKT